MITKKHKLFSNPWFIGTGSSLLAVIISDYYVHTKILSSIWSAIILIANLIVDFFHIKFQVSLWFLILLPILVLGLIALILWLMSIKKEEKEEAKGFSFLEYKEDQFGDILYRWDYIRDYYSGKIVVDNLTHYCPKCKCAIVHDICPICHTSFWNKFRSHDEIIALISHQIERRQNLNK